MAYEGETLPEEYTAQMMNDIEGLGELLDQLYTGGRISYQQCNRLCMSLATVALIVRRPHLHYLLGEVVDLLTATKKLDETEIGN